MNRLATAVALAAITLLGWLSFPGHTWLIQDTQIYAPILEHLRDPSVLGQDILVQRPHVNFTLYDEITNGLRSLTGLSQRDALWVQQLTFRAAGLCGILLIALALGLAQPLALLVAAMCALGGPIIGPAVLMVEYEPTPRAFALPLLFLAIGLLTRNRPVWAGVSGALAFLYHPPTVLPFWLLLGAATLWRRERKLALAFMPLAIAAVILIVASRLQPGVREPQKFFSRIPPDQEALQRMRGAYNWVSTWWPELHAQYLACAAVVAAAGWRLRDRLRGVPAWFVLGLPAIGLLSIPFSWFFLEKLKWVLIPQYQPGRMLLFTAAFAVLLAAAAGCRAAARGRWWEAALWFLPVYWIPCSGRWFESYPAPATWTIVALLVFTTACILLWRRSPRAGMVAILAACGAPMLALPYVGKITHYRELRTAPFEQLTAWARTSTPKDANFLFADAGQSGLPGVFRTEALRAVYVDWKGGGQVNFLRELGNQWWQRYRTVLGDSYDPARFPLYATLGVDYVVLHPQHQRPGIAPVYSNAEFVVYRVRP